MKDLKRILSHVRPYGGFVVLSLLCAAISAGAQLLIPIFTGEVLDVLTGTEQVVWAGIIKMLAYIGASALLAAVAQQLLAMSNNRITFSVCRDLRNRVSEKLQKLPLSYLDRHPSGDLVSRMVGDVDTFADADTYVVSGHRLYCRTHPQALPAAGKGSGRADGDG